MADERFIGAWDLVSAETRDANGNVTDDPLAGFAGSTGLIVYTADGRVSVQLAGPDRPALAIADYLTAPVEERAAAYSSYIAYHGTYRVDDARGVVVHRVLGALWGGLVGADQIRDFTFDGDRLTLSTPPFDGAQSHLTWRRVPAS